MNRFATLFLGLVILFAIAAEPLKDPTTEKGTDRERLQGTWNITDVEFDGKPLSDGPSLRQFKGVRLTFEGDQVINSRTFKKSSFKVDNTATGVLDIVEPSSDGDHKMLYLYRLEGDTLKLCFTNQSGTTRPMELTSQNKQIVLVLKRRKL